MDNLKSLLDQKKYDLVIKLTESSQTANDLFYRISAFICLEKYEEALYVIQDHQKILETNLAPLINAHINLLCALSRFDQAYSVLEYYSNLPYQSQVVEEILRKMPSIIENEEKRNNGVKYYDDDEICRLLKSNKEEEVLMALDIIKGRDVLLFINEISELLLSDKKEAIKSYALMLLVRKEVDRSLKMNKNGEIIEVNPKYLDIPFTGTIFNEVIKYFDKEFHDRTLAQTATQLFSQYVIYIYPNKITRAPKLYGLALYIISSSYTGKEYSEDEIATFAKQKEFDLEELNQLIIELKNVFNNF